MATYYVRTNGSDNNTGTGPAPSQAWATVGKAMQTVTSGDTVWIAPGVYFNHIGLTPTNTYTNAVTFVGDLYGEAFTDLVGGIPWIVPYSGMNGSMISGSNYTFDFSSKPNVTLRRLAILGAWDNGITISAAGITIEECLVIPRPQNAAIWIWPAAGATINAVISRCRIGDLQGGGVRIVFPRHTANYNANITISSSYVARVTHEGTGTGSGLGGGVTINGCTVYTMGESAVVTGASAVSTTYPVSVKNSVVIAGGRTFDAAASGEIVENYNLAYGSTTHINTNQGANTIVMGTNAPSIYYTACDTLLPWPVLERTPYPTSLLHTASLDTDAPTTDIAGRPRTSRGAVSVAAVGEASASSDADGGTGRALMLTGRSSHDIAVPVDAASTTVSVKVKWDSNHGDGNPPQAQLLAAPELGYSGQTLTASAPGTSYQTLTFTAFTPSRAGVVTLRLISRAASASGKAWFDTISVT